MRILGIDPGIATVGFGVVDFDRENYTLQKCGVITTPAHTSLSSRLNQIYDDMTELIGSFRPDCLSIEELFFNTNITTGISVAHGRGVILLAAYKSNVPVYEYTPLQVKQSVVGYGRAEKKQVMDMSHQNVLRYWLIHNEFTITRELLVRDSGALYQIFTAVYGTAPHYSDAELFTGKYEQISADPLFGEYLDGLIAKFAAAVRGMGFLLQGFEGDISKLWESNIFGKSLYDIAGEGLTAKITGLPQNARSKLQETLQKIVNEGSGGLICIIL